MFSVHTTPRALSTIQYAEYNASHVYYTISQHFCTKLFCGRPLRNTHSLVLRVSIKLQLKSWSIISVHAYYSKDSGYNIAI